MIIYTYIDVLVLIMLQGKGDCSTRKLTVNFGNFDQLAMCDVFFLKVACGYQPIWNYKTLWTRYWLGAYLKDYDRLCLMFMDCVAMLRWLTDSSILSMTNFHLARGMVELEFVEVGGGGKCCNTETTKEYGRSREQGRNGVAHGSANNVAPGSSDAMHSHHCLIYTQCVGKPKNFRILLIGIYWLCPSPYKICWSAQAMYGAMMNPAMHGAMNPYMQQQLAAQQAQAAAYAAYHQQMQQQQQRLGWAG